MNDYFKRFNLKSSEFKFLLYWPYEKGLLPNFLRPLSHKGPEISPKPLTVSMLLESAKAGCWLLYELMMPINQYSHYSTLRLTF